MGSQVSSDEMSVRAGQGSDEVLVSQAVWDYLAAAGRPWLIDFQHKQGMSAGIIRRGERGGCCAVRLQPVDGSRSAGAGVMDGPISSETRRAFIDLCRCARKEMSKQEGGSKRKRALLPCVGVLEPNGEGSLLQPPPPQPRRSQRQQQRFRKPADEEACAMLHEVTHRKDMDPSLASHSEAEDNNTCSICMGDIVEKTTLEKCGHSFCRSCLDQAFKVKKACPVCRLVYGQLIGNQPANGSMIVERDSDLELPGHEGYGCICIIYSFPPGLQAPEHPNPGVRYPGTDRVAYLPDSPEGNRVLGLLRRAFEQRLIFTIGTSMTTGMQNVITSFCTSGGCAVGSVVSSVASNLEDPWFVSQPEPGIFLLGVCMFSLCICGVSSGSPASSLTPPLLCIHTRKRNLSAADNDGRNSEQQPGAGLCHLPGQN